MANADTPRGLEPVGTLSGAPWNQQVRLCHILATYGTALYVGDPVVITGTASDRGYPEIQIATAGATNNIYGVIVSFKEDPTALHRIYSPLSTEGWAYVCLANPDIIWRIQDDGGGTLTEDIVGNNAVLIAGSGSTTTGLSGWEMDGGTATGPGNDSTYQLNIIGVDDRTDNDPDSDNCDWLVTINLPHLRVAATGI